MKTTSVSDFRTNMKRYFDAVTKDNDCVLINRGNTAAVLIPLDEYNSIHNSEILLSSDTLSGPALQGIKDLSEGRYDEIDINDL
jgi:antitoxin YefM